MSIFLFSIQHKKYNDIVKILIIYLIDFEVKKRVINILSSLNIYVFYIIAQSIIKKLKNIEANKIYICNICLNDIDINSLIFYDNYNFIKHKFIEQLKSRKTQRNIITAIQRASFLIFESNLRQNI